MFPTIFALALLAHLSSDFLLQTDRIAWDKKRGKDGWRSMAMHMAAAFPLNVMAFYLLLDGWWPLLGAAVITAAHYFIDCLKDRIRCEKHRTFTFLIDQALHIIVIIAVVYVVSMNANQTATGYYSLLKPLLLLPAWSAEADKILWTAITGVACVWGGACFIRFLLKDLNIDPGMAPENPDENKYSHAGKLIGILERIAILILIPLGQWAAVGLLLTAKSIARHDLMNKQEYAEYYLIGTLSSFITAVVGGLLISGIWS